MSFNSLVYGRGVLAETFGECKAFRQWLGRSDQETELLTAVQDVLGIGTVSLLNMAAGEKLYTLLDLVGCSPIAVNGLTEPEKCCWHDVSPSQERTGTMVKTIAIIALLRIVWSSVFQIHAAQKNVVQRKNCLCSSLLDLC